MIEIVNKGAGKVAYGTELAAGFDIPSNENVTIMPGEWKVVKTGLFLRQPTAEELADEQESIDSAAHLPELDDLAEDGDIVILAQVFQLEIRPRSGLAAKYGVTVLNAPGTVDQDYAQEIGVILINHGKNPFEIKVGDRIAQGVVTSAFRDIPGVEESSTKRQGGFGSTGVQ